MSFMISNKELESFLSLSQKDAWVNHLWQIMQKRAGEHTTVPGITQPQDTQEWWHLVEERLFDVVFVRKITGDAHLGEWIHDTILQICGKSSDEWIGPWFRARKNPPTGQLETAHVSVAVATALDLCEDLFSSEEKESILGALKEKGMLACLRYMDEHQGIPNNNWYMVLLDGFATAAAVLGDKAALQRAAREYAYCETLYNKDSYGESLQYWNYASLKLCHLYEILFRFDPQLTEGLGLPYTGCIPWACSSLLYVKPLLGGWGDRPFTRCVNYGDSAAIYRISGDLALHIARRAAEKDPVNAGLARWLFETGYKDAELASNERSTFGFINNFSFYTLLHYAQAAKAVTPEEAKLPLTASYEVGHVIVRDSFTEPKTIISMQGGYEPLNTAAHRHRDQNSFTVAHLNERFFVDPGHCCYRLFTHSFTQSTKSHSTWRFLLPDGSSLEQKGIGHDNRHLSLNRRLLLETDGNITVTASDAAGLYGAPVKKARRMLVSVMPHVLFIVDTIEAESPLKVEANFIVNNRDNALKYNVAAPDRLVLRRHGSGMKFFLSQAQPSCRFSFSWSCVHEAYHPLPNQLGQGKEGSALVFTQTSEDFSEKHRMVYVIAMSEEPKIKSWHIYSNKTDLFEAEAPGGAYRVSLQLTEDGLVVRDGASNREFGIKV